MKLFISAGETSGDRLGAALMSELSAIAPGSSFYGMGGAAMAAAGLHRAADCAEVSVVGILEVLTHLPAIYRVNRRLLRQARVEKPAAAVLIDFPDFHFHLGKQLAAMDIPVIYYVSPQVWAWRKGRVRTMKKFVRRVVTLFPFEVPIYQEEGIDAVCAGHPLADEVARNLACAAELPPRQAGRRIVLLPGSRRGEIGRHWAVLRDTAALLGKSLDAEFFAVPAPGIPPRSFSGAEENRITLFQGNMDLLMASADLVISASGTATLEAALCGAPLVVIYKMNPVTFTIAKRFVRMPHIALANIVAEESVAPELLQNEATPERIAGEAAAILHDPSREAWMRKKWAAIRQRMGPPGAAARAARAVWEALAA